VYGARAAAGTRSGYAIAAAAALALAYVARAASGCVVVFVCVIVSDTVAVRVTFLLARLRHRHRVVVVRARGAGRRAVPAGDAAAVSRGGDGSQTLGWQDGDGAQPCADDGGSCRKYWHVREESSNTA
jgi:hypothetical protein